MTARMIPVSRTASGRLEKYVTCLARISIESRSTASAGVPAMKLNAAAALRAPDSTGIGLLPAWFPLFMAIRSATLVRIDRMPRRGWFSAGTMRDQEPRSGLDATDPTWVQLRKRLRNSGGITAHASGDLNQRLRLEATNE